MISMAIKAERIPLSVPCNAFCTDAAAAGMLNPVTAHSAIKIERIRFMIQPP